MLLFVNDAIADLAVFIGYNFYCVFALSPTTVADDGDEVAAVKGN